MLIKLEIASNVDKIFLTKTVEYFQAIEKPLHVVV